MQVRAVLRTNCYIKILQPATASLQRAQPRLFGLGSESLTASSCTYGTDRCQLQRIAENTKS